MKQGRQGFSPDEIGAWVEWMMLTAQHPGLACVTPTAHSVYMRLVGFCWMHGRESVPPAYLSTKILTRALMLSKVQVLINSVSQLERTGLISVPIWPPKGDQIANLVVVGLEDKIRGRAWKAPKNRIEENRILKEEGATPKTASCPTSFPEVFSVLQSIDAKHYRTCQPSEGFERDLAAQSSRLGKGRVCQEAEGLRSWLEGQFATGKLRRDAAHNPQARLIRWLRKCDPGDNGNGNRNTRESYTDRILREARERQTASG